MEGEITFSFSQILAVLGFLIGAALVGWRLYIITLRNSYDSRLQDCEQRLEAISNRITTITISQDKKIKNNLTPLSENIQSVAKDIEELKKLLHEVDKIVAILSTLQDLRT